MWAAGGHAVPVVPFGCRHHPCPGVLADGPAWAPVAADAVPWKLAEKALGPWPSLAPLPALLPTGTSRAV